MAMAQLHPAALNQAVPAFSRCPVNQRIMVIFIVRYLRDSIALNISKKKPSFTGDQGTGDF
jgi:hypothetical protein